MTDNEFLLFDRIEKIKSVIGQYGEENFALSFSGGKDSVVLSALVDMAIPENKIPRVYANTGIELNMIRDFVFELRKADDRIVMISPSVPIKKMLEQDGYPFKSKEHSEVVATYQRNGGNTRWVRHYLEREEQRYRCQDRFLYQFTPECTLRISDKCCDRLKEEPLKKWQKENRRPYWIVGIMRSEGGRRSRAKYLAFSGKKLKAFQPLTVVTKKWEEWFISTYNVRICDIYKPPYNFTRTGCKGCPFAPDLQKNLDILEEFFPAERKQCELIWKPVYDEYRRIGYRLRKQEEYHQITIAEWEGRKECQK